MGLGPATEAHVRGILKIGFSSLRLPPAALQRTGEGGGGGGGGGSAGLP